MSPTVTMKFVSGMQWCSLRRRFETWTSTTRGLPIQCSPQMVRSSSPRVLTSRGVLAEVARRPGR
jgi:hypothetical protein